MEKVSKYAEILYGDAKDFARVEIMQRTEHYTAILVLSSVPRH